MATLFARLRKKTKEPEGQKPGIGWKILREFFAGKRRAEVNGIACWGASALILAALWPQPAGQNALGPMGEIFFRLAFAGVGAGMYLLPLAGFAYGWILYRGLDPDHLPLKLLGGVAALLCAGILVELVYPHPVWLARVAAFYAWDGAGRFWNSLPGFLQLWEGRGFPWGGMPARAVKGILVAVFSVTGTAIVSLTLLVVSAYLLGVEERLKQWTRWLHFFRHPEDGKTGKEKPFVEYAAPRKRPKPDPGRLIRLDEPAPEAEEKPRIHLPAVPAGRPAPAPAGEAAPAPAGGTPYQLPSLDFLEDARPRPGITAGYFEALSNTLEGALRQFGVEAKVVDVCPGPVVTRYELQPSPGVKVNRILSLADDISLAMRAEHIRIEAPIPGKGAVGIEIPNPEKQVVVLKELLADPAFQRSESVLTFALGKDIGGQHAMARLDAMPHLLIAGATGSGKSACINAILCSLLYRATPQQLKFLMVDPKRVELTVYNGIPHLKSPVITDSREAAVALKFLVREMDERYKLFAQVGVRDIGAFNQRVREQDADSGQPTLAPMPYTVIVIDELADLMLVAAQEVENAITRLAQMARGVGMHLVLATQRPSVDVITGVIKANFPSRIAFQVSSKVDSRTILDANGADALLGRGDMLYAPASSPKPVRLQGVFVTTQEVERVVKFWAAQGKPVYDPVLSLPAGQSGTGNGEEGGEDELYAEAVSWVIRAKQASTSMLQRRLKVGYSRAARLLDLMEEKGIVGPPDGSKPRRVLVEAEEQGVDPAAVR